MGHITCKSMGRVFGVVRRQRTGPSGAANDVIVQIVTKATDLHK